MSANRILVFLALFAFAGCKEQIVQEAEPITKDRFGRTAEVGLEPEALSLKELTFMVRAQSTDAEIVAELNRRGLAEPIDENARRQLTESGATARFIESVQASPALLNAQERALYAERRANRSAAASAAANDHDRWVDESRADLTKKVYTAQSTLLENQRKELNAKIAKLRADQSRENYSRNISSPYQGFERQIAEVNTEVAKLSSEIDKLSQSTHTTRR